jgi:hypothetical protein
LGVCQRLLIPRRLDSRPLSDTGRMLRLPVGAACPSRATTEARRREVNLTAAAWRQQISRFPNGGVLLARARPASRDSCQWPRPRCAHGEYSEYPASTLVPRARPDY